jgi:hypothetical protein
MPIDRRPDSYLPNLLIPSGNLQVIAANQKIHLRLLRFLRLEIFLGIPPHELKVLELDETALVPIIFQKKNISCRFFRRMEWCIDRDNNR